MGPGDFASTGATAIIIACAPLCPGKQRRAAELFFIVWQAGVRFLRIRVVRLEVACFQSRRDCFRYGAIFTLSVAVDKYSWASSAGTGVSGRSFSTVFVLFDNCLGGFVKAGKENLARHVEKL